VAAARAVPLWEVGEGIGHQLMVAGSFSRTYYRNAVNNGLLPVVRDTR
jgi:3-isopropylmalate dehydratase small subunit